MRHLTTLWAIKVGGDTVTQDAQRSRNTKRHRSELGPNAGTIPLTDPHLGLPFTAGHTSVFTYTKRKWTWKQNRP